MGMRPIDVIAIVGKTHDATLAVQQSSRAHGTMQDQIAGRQSAKADLASEQVSALAADDRLELSTGEYAGKGGGGGDTHHREGEAPEDDLDDRALPTEHHVDFLA